MTKFVLKAETRRHQVADFLRAEILGGVRSAGSPLREIELSKSLGVSRGPIREALRELEKEGLLEVRPYSGTCVARLKFEQILEVYEVRSVLEKKAFELLWGERDESFREEIIKRHDTLLKAIASGDGRAIVAAEQEFHALPFERCGNSTLLNFWTQLSQRLRLSFMLHSEVFSENQSYSEAHVDYLQAALGEKLEAMLSEIDSHLSLGVNLIKSRMKKWE